MSRMIGYPDKNFSEEDIDKKYENVSQPGDTVDQEDTRSVRRFRSVRSHFILSWLERQIILAVGYFSELR